MIDSTGSIFGSGILSGTYTNFGDFDACLNIESNSIIGQYCFATIHLPKNVSMFYGNDDLITEENNFNVWKKKLINRWLEANHRFPIANALCMPAVCRPEFIQNILLNGIGI